MPTFDVNMDAAIALTAKLERLHRSAFPVAVRQTLNDAVYKTTLLIPKVAQQKFITRNPTFMKSHTAKNKAKGWDVNKMRAVAGMNANKDSEVMQGLEQQETGGVVKSRKLIPHDLGRVRGSHGSKLSSVNKFDGISIHDATSAYRFGRKKRASKFAAAAFSAQKRGTRYFLLKKGGKGTVFKLKKPLSSSLKKRKLKLKFVPVYTYRNTKKSFVPKTPFVSVSAQYAAKKLPSYYKKNAEYQFKRALQ